MSTEFSTRLAAPEQDSSALFLLMDEIYASTEMMCEDLSEKYSHHEMLRLELEEIASLPGALFLVAEKGSQLIGYICVKPLRQSKLAHTAYVNMGIASIARGKSLGRTLLASALKKVEEDAVIEILHRAALLPRCQLVH
jgi:N-acetylglutamate synthase-like GNAT family acetyltransferase